MHMDGPRNAEAKEEIPIEELSRRLKDLEQDWQSFKNPKQKPNLRFRRRSRRYSSADAAKIVKTMMKDDQYRSNMTSPRQLMESLQLQTSSPPSTEHCGADLNHDESAVCEIQRDERKLAYGSLEGRRLFGDSECGITRSGSIVTTDSQLCVHEEVCSSFSTDLVEGTAAETESMISYACNTGHVMKEKSSTSSENKVVKEYCQRSGSCSSAGPCIKVKEYNAEKESNAAGWGGGQNRRGGAGRKAMMFRKACVVFAVMLSVMGIIMIRRFGGHEVEEKVFFLVPT